MENIMDDCYVKVTVFKKGNWFHGFSSLTTEIKIQIKSNILN